MKKYDLNQIKQLLGGAKSILITIPQLNIDSAASALALALLLKKSNVNVQVFSPQKPDQNYSKLNGTELLTDVFNPNDLVISITHPLENIDTVTYNDDGGRLNLVVKTKPNGQKIENNQININNQSASFDVGVILGDDSVISQNQNMFNQGKWILISPVNLERPYIKAKLVDQDAPYSEIFTFMLPMLGFDLDSQSAKNLLIALRVATQSFSVNVSPETFEAGAYCLRATQMSEDLKTTTPSQTPIEKIETEPQSDNLNPNKPSSLPTN